MTEMSNSSYNLRGLRRTFSEETALQMSITVPEQFAAFLRDSVANGRFRSEDEAVTEALRLLQRQEERLGTLRADLQIGIDDLDSGRVHELDVEDIKHRGLERLRARKSAE